MPKSIFNEIELAHERYAMADTVVGLCEGFRQDYFPKASLLDAFVLLLVLRRMVDRHRHGRLANATCISQATGIPRTTVQRRLAQLESLGAIREQRSSQFVVVPEFMNTPERLEGFVRRRERVGIAYKRMHGTAEG
jgi:hypothetical protein